MLAAFGLFVLGLLVLVAGAEALVRGAVRVAAALGVSPFVIGFTIVGFGTSAPELAVSLSAALREPDPSGAGGVGMALGNIVGSNIANVGLILGAAAVVRPLAARMRLLRVEVPLMIGVTLLLWFLARDNALSRIDGGILLAGFVAVAVYTFRTAREEPAEVQQEVATGGKGKSPVPLAVVLVVLGLAGLVGGAHLMVESAVEIAAALGVSRWLIGLTVVAVGTSLPELAASVAAAARGQADIALGNVIGSNIFNVLLILGITLTVRPMAVGDPVLFRELPAMALFSLLLVPVLANGMKVHRWEGAVLLAAYAGFIAWQVTGAAK